MNWLDITLLILMLVSVVISFTKGFSREIIGLISAFAAFLCGIWFYGTAAALVEPYVSSRGVANFCGFALIFIGVLIVGAIAGHILSRILKLAGLSWFDRLLGAGFGALRGLLLGIALVMAIVAFTPGKPVEKPPQAVVDSRLAPYVVDAAHLFAAIAPRELKDGFRKHYEQVKKIWEEVGKKGGRKLPSTEV
jgi:membrane protein required for colicin V production